MKTRRFYTVQFVEMSRSSIDGKDAIHVEGRAALTEEFELWISLEAAKQLIDVGGFVPAFRFQREVQIYFHTDTGVLTIHANDDVEDGWDLYACSVPFLDMLQDLLT